MHDDTEVDDEKKFFMREELFSQAWRDATARAGMYSKIDSKPENKKIQEDWKNKIKKKALRILREFSKMDSISNKDKELIEKIECLRNYSDKIFDKILKGYINKDGFKIEFRIGQSQKLLNMLLKYYWGMGWLKEPPPHCPIDRYILEKTKAKNGKNATPSWTKMDDIGEYKRYIESIKEVAEEAGLSIAKWELQKWNCRKKTKNSKSNN